MEDEVLHRVTGYWCDRKSVLRALSMAFRAPGSGTVKWLPHKMLLSPDLRTILIKVSKSVVLTALDIFCKTHLSRPHNCNTRNSSVDEIANVNFLQRHPTRTTATKFTSPMESTYLHSCQMRLFQLGL